MRARRTGHWEAEEGKSVQSAGAPKEGKARGAGTDRQKGGRERGAKGRGGGGSGTGEARGRGPAQSRLE